MVRISAWILAANLQLMSMLTFYEKNHSEKSSNLEKVKNQWFWPDSPSTIIQTMSPEILEKHHIWHHFCSNFFFSMGVICFLEFASDGFSEVLKNPGKSMIFGQLHMDRAIFSFVFSWEGVFSMETCICHGKQVFPCSEGLLAGPWWTHWYSYRIIEVSEPPGAARMARKR